MGLPATSRSRQGHGGEGRGGLLRLDPRTLLGLLVASTLLSFLGLPLWLEATLVLVLALLQAACGHAALAVRSVVTYVVVVATLDLVLARLGIVFVSAFTYSLSLARSVFLCGMCCALIVAECSVHRAAAALRALHAPEPLIIPFSTTLRYFPTLVRDAGHIRDAMALRDIPLLERLEAFVVPLMVCATNTADDLSCAAVCRGIEDPSRVTDTEGLRMCMADWAALASAALAVAVVRSGVLL